MQAPREGGRSPWGKIDSVKTMIVGQMWLVGTPSHGGVKLSPGLNAKVPGIVRRVGGWYEEDVDWAIPFFLFMPKDPSWPDAHRVLKEYYPDEYRSLTGHEVSATESHVIRSRLFSIRHKNDWVTISAFGDWHPKVPKGMVGVIATLGGRRSGTERAFITTAARYKEARNAPYVVDLTTDAEIPMIR